MGFAQSGKLPLPLFHAMSYHIYLLIILGPLFGGLILYWIIQYAVKAPGRTLQQKFANLGMLAGKRKDEIVGVVGPPNSISQHAEGELLQWIATSYHVALLFDDSGVCLGVTHETSV